MPREGVREVLRGKRSGDPEMLSKADQAATSPQTAQLGGTEPTDLPCARRRVENAGKEPLPWRLNRA